MEKIIISFSIIVILLAGAFGIWTITAPCETLRDVLPFANAQNRCIEPTKAQEPVQEPVQAPRLVESVEVEAAINQFRAEKGLPALYTENAALDTAAQIRADTMCAENDWSHDNAWTVLNQYYSYTSVSENLYYWSLVPDQAAHSIDRWSESPGHLENMLKDHKEVGVGVKFCPGYQGNETAVIIANYFGVPR